MRALKACQLYCSHKNTVITLWHNFKCCWCTKDKNAAGVAIFRGLRSVLSVENEQTNKNWLWVTALLCKIKREQTHLFRSECILYATQRTCRKQNTIFSNVCRQTIYRNIFKLTSLTSLLYLHNTYLKPLYTGFFSGGGRHTFWLWHETWNLNSCTNGNTERNRLTNVKYCTKIKIEAY